MVQATPATLELCIYDKLSPKLGPIILLNMRSLYCSFVFMHACNVIEHLLFFKRDFLWFSTFLHKIHYASNVHVRIIEMKAWRPDD